MKFDIYSRLYLAHHKFSSSIENEMFDTCSPVVQTQIIKFAKSLLLYEIHDKLTIVALNEREKEQFENFSEMIGVAYDLIDVTEKAVLGELKTSRLAMKKVVNPYLKRNLTVDLVLDKINIKGIESLSSIDRLILEEVSSN
jgi:hypothetical protein